MPEPITDEFDELATQLQAERPSIDAAFARLLDERAAAGFPKQRRRFTWYRVPGWLRAGGGLAVAGAAAVMIAVGVAGGGSESDDAASGGGSGAASTSAAQAPSAAQGESSGAGGGSAGATADQQAARAVPPADRDLSRGRAQALSTAITIAAPPGEIAAVGDEILQVVAQVGGFVESSNVRSTDGESGSGSFAVRIPVDRLEDGLARLSRLGNVRERTSGSQDITSERNVARERLQEGAALRRSLLERLAGADTDAEVEALRAQLRTVNAQIGAARADLRRVQRRAAYAEVSVTLVAAERNDGAAASGGDEWTPGDALADAGRVLEVVAGVLVVVAAVVLPLALLAGAWVATRRGLRRRGRERALDAT